MSKRASGLVRINTFYAAHGKKVDLNKKVKKFGILEMVPLAILIQIQEENKPFPWFWGHLEKFGGKRFPVMLQYQGQTKRFWVDMGSSDPIQKLRTEINSWRYKYALAEKHAVWHVYVMASWVSKQMEADNSITSILATIDMAPPGKYTIPVESSVLINGNLERIHKAVESFCLGAKVTEVVRKNGHAEIEITIQPTFVL